MRMLSFSISSPSRRLVSTSLSCSGRTKEVCQPSVPFRIENYVRMTHKLSLHAVLVLLGIFELVQQLGLLLLELA